MNILYLHAYHSLCTMHKNNIPPCWYSNDVITSVGNKKVRLSILRGRRHSAKREPGQDAKIRLNFRLANTEH